MHIIAVTSGERFSTARRCPIAFLRTLAAVDHSEPARYSANRRTFDVLRCGCIFSIRSFVCKTSPAQAAKPNMINGLLRCVRPTTSCSASLP